MMISEVLARDGADVADSDVFLTCAECGLESNAAIIGHSAGSYSWVTIYMCPNCQHTLATVEGGRYNLHGQGMRVGRTR